MSGVGRGIVKFIEAEPFREDFENLELYWKEEYDVC